MISFELPLELIAQQPAHPRDSAKLLVYDKKTKIITDAHFRDINDYLPETTTVAINNSKVEHCRWLFRDGSIEIFVLSKQDTNTVTALVRPGKKFKLGTVVHLDKGLEAVVEAIDDDGVRTLRMNIDHSSQRLLVYEHVPLPPYIKQDDTLANEYQTVYAKSEGSKAAPTAGLHFTNELIEKTKSLHHIAELTLHVGLGTFAALTTDQLKLGRLHSEWYSIDANNQKILQDAQHITAIGTTTIRTLETIKEFTNSVIAGKTDILIQPGYVFRHANALVTNFHLPGTSLLLLVEAFVGSEKELDRIYRHAIKNHYRFYSFGDAMLII